MFRSIHQSRSCSFTFSGIKSRKPHTVHSFLTHIWEALNEKETRYQVESGQTLQPLLKALETWSTEVAAHTPSALQSYYRDADDFSGRLSAVVAFSSLTLLLVFIVLHVKSQFTSIYWKSIKIFIKNVWANEDVMCRVLLCMTYFLHWLLSMLWNPNCWWQYRSGCRHHNKLGMWLILTMFTLS